MKKALITLLGVVLIIQCHAQKSIDLSFGFGFPELLHVGLRGQIAPQAQLGITYGRFGEEIALSSDLYFHFGKEGKHAERKLWYYRLGINRSSEVEEINKDIYWYLDNRMGKDFYFSSRFGANVDLGVAILLSHTVKNEMSTGGFFSEDEIAFLPVLPAFTTGFFYRF